MTTTSRLIVPVLAALAMVIGGVSGCASDDDPPQAADPADAPSVSDDRPDPVASSRLTIVDFMFEPSPVTVAAGDRIQIVNEDDADHTITSGSRDDAGEVFDVDVDALGSGELVIEDPGTYEYICVIHPGMKGAIEVTP